MRFLNKILTLLILLGVASFTPVTCLGAGLPELDEMRQEFAIKKRGVVEKQERRSVYISYINKLRVFESDLRLIRGDIEGASVVREEISAVKEELAAPPKVEVEAEVPVEASSFVVKDNSGSQAVSDLKDIPPLYDPLAEEEAAKKAAENAAAEAARKIAEAEAAQEAAEEAAQKARELANARAAAAAADAARKAAQKEAAEAAARKFAEEAAKKAAAEEAVRKAAEEAAQKAVAEEAARIAAEEAAKKAAAEEAARIAAEEAAKKAAAEEAARKAAEEAAKKAAAVAVTSVVPQKPQPAAKAVVKQKTDKIHISNVQGQAAAADFSRNNIYEFKLSSVGKFTTLTYYATGRNNIDSEGNIWLVTPDGRRVKASAWDKNDEMTVGASSYKDLKAIDIDISEFVTRPGTYQVEFEWLSGNGPLYIYRVEMTS